MNIDNIEFYSWQSTPWQELQRARRQDRLPHALLLSGPSGIGKMSFAQAFAASILCKQTNESNEFRGCKQCSACQMLRAGHHPDCFVILPGEGAKPTIKIDQIRALCEKLVQTSHSGLYQVVIINPVEAMTEAASNALLKIIEEPPGPLLFLLLTERPMAIMATIRSRCQALPFLPASFEQARAFFVQNNIPEEQHELCYQLSDGSPLRALDMMGSELLTQRQGFYEEVVKLLRGELDPVAVAQQYQSIKLEILMVWLESYLHDVIRYCYGLESFSTNKDQVPLMPKLTQKGSLQACYKYLDNIQMVRNLQHNGGNLNPLMLLEDLLIRLVHLAKQSSIKI